MKEKTSPTTVTRSTKGAATRHKILMAAVELVYRKGFNATSIDDVLAASGAGKSQFYHYFGSKEQLVVDIIKHHVASMPAVQAPLLSRLDTLSGIEAWLAQIDADYSQGLYRLGCPIGNLANELAAQSEELRQSLEAIFSIWEDALIRGLKIMKTNGAIRPDVVPESIAMFAISAIEGALLLAKTHKGQAPLKATLEQIKTHLDHCTTGATAKKPKAPRRQIQTFFCP